MIELLIKLITAQIGNLHILKAIEDEYEEFEEDIPLWHGSVDISYLVEAWSMAINEAHGES